MTRRFASSTRRPVVFVVALALACLMAPGSSGASDFWDEVREPGIARYRVHVRRALGQLGARQFDQALETIAVAVEALPDRPEAHAIRAIALAERRDTREAVVEARRALELDPGAFDDTLLGARIARLMARSGEPELASRVLTRLLLRMPPNPTRRALFALHGDVLQSLGPDHLADAARAYREALRTGMHDSRSLLGLALALRRQGDRDEADVLARRAVAPGSLDDVIRRVPVRETERAARRAVAAEAAGDTTAARAAWAEARADNVWGEWADTQLTTPGPRRRPRRRPR